MSKIILETKKLSKTFMSSEDREINVLNEVDLKVDRGDFIAIMGESGSGKSTLLNLLGGLDTPGSGEIYINDKNILTQSEANLATFRNKNVGFIFQNHNLLPEFSVLENLLLPYRIYNKNKKAGILRAEMLLEKAGILDRKNHLCGEISGGEMQRASIIRSLMCTPELILADEPTGNLDDKNSLNIFNMLFDIAKKENTSILMVTHSKVLAQKCNKVYKLSNGKLC